MKSVRFSRLSLSLGFFALLTACAHYPDVRPAADGIHKVSFQTEGKDEGFQKGFAQAKDYCDDTQKKRAVTVSEASEYIGSMDEKTYNNLKMASKITGAIGGAGLILGGKNEQKAGGAAAVGGGIADSALGTGYKYTMTFKCE